MHYSLTICSLFCNHSIVCIARQIIPAIGKKRNKQTPKNMFASGYVPIHISQPKNCKPKFLVNSIATTKIMFSGNSNKIAIFLRIVLTISFIFLSSFNHCSSNHKTVTVAGGEKA